MPFVPFNFDDDQGVIDDGSAVFDGIGDILKVDHPRTEEFRESVRKARQLINEWSYNRRHLIQDIRKTAQNLNEWEKGCAISTTVGSSVGVASGFAVIGGLIMMPPVAIAGMIVGVAAGASNFITGVSKGIHWNTEVNKVKEMLAKDEELFKKMVESRQELMELLQGILADETFYKKLPKLEIEVLLKTNLGLTAFCTSGAAAGYAMKSMGRLTSSLVKGVLHSAAVIGIVLDGVTLALSAKDLATGKKAELAVQLEVLCFKLEAVRDNICRNFWNSDEWKIDDDDPPPYSDSDAQLPWNVMTDEQKIDKARETTAPEKRFVIVTMNNITS